MSTMAIRWRLDDAAAAGLHRVGSGDVEALCQAGRAARLYCVRLDLEKCTSKTALLGSVARALEFPAWFGHNWDALADCLDDLEWLRAPGCLLVLENPQGMSAAAPRDFGRFLEILAETAGKWRERGMPFWVFLPDRENDEQRG